MKRQKQHKPWRTRAGALLLGLAMFSSMGGVARGASGAGEGSMPKTLIPIGHTVGIKLFSEGVLVVGLSELETNKGTAAPAKDCGLKVGDFILEADGEEVESTEHFQSLMAAAGGEETCLTVKRNGKTMELEVSGVQCSDGAWRLGAWVRDSLAGIGTMTFYDPESGVFATLGHGINDVDTGQLMTLDVGSIMGSTVKAVQKGVSGQPGELRGDFDVSGDLGDLYANTACGVFGTMDSCPMAANSKAMEAARPDQVRKGSAEILANISGDQVERYQVEITKICSGSGDTQNFIIKVTDPKLLEATGGIVQGMSGSPVIQDGRLIGAVTHVMVDDPTSGYGIFIENMLNAAGLSG